MKRLSMKMWKYILRNLDENGEGVEVLYLDSDDEYCLCYECELFEDGFKTEEAARERLNYLINNI